MQRTRGTSRAHPSAGSSRGSSSTDAVTAVARPLALDHESDSDFHLSNTDGHTSDGMESDEQRYANVAAVIAEVHVNATDNEEATSGAEDEDEDEVTYEAPMHITRSNSAAADGDRDGDVTTGGDGAFEVGAEGANGGDEQEVVSVTIPVDGKIRLTTGTKTICLGDPVNVLGDSNMTAKVKSVNKEKLARKWVRALKGMCNDAKRGLECALDVLCNASNKKAKAFGFGGDGDARRWPPNKHVRKSVQAALDHIKAPWTSEMSLLIQLALGVSNDKLNRLREMLSFNLSRDSNGVHLQPTRRCFEVQGQQFQVPAILGADAASRAQKRLSTVRRIQVHVVFPWLAFPCLPFELMNFVL